MKPIFIKRDSSISLFIASEDSVPLTEHFRSTGFAFEILQGTVNLQIDTEPACTVAEIQVKGDLNAIKLMVRDFYRNK